MGSDVKTVRMTFVGHPGPGGQAFRGRDELLGRDLNLKAGDEAEVSEALALHLERSPSWRRVTPDAAVAPPRRFKRGKG